MKILVLGGYGLIGQAIVRALIASGHVVTGLGRSLSKGKRSVPSARWISADLTRLTSPDDWRNILHGFDVVVNAAGVLQNGLKDNVAAVQRDAVVALISACQLEQVRQLVHISAVGVRPSTQTQFYQTKAEAEAFIRASDLEWVILRPGLVLSPHAYGGSGLLRMLAAVPWIQPVLLKDAQIETVHVEDVADAVQYCVDHKVSRFEADLVESDTHSLEEIILAIRGWLGFQPPKFVISVPPFLGALVAKLADAAGWLGWRPPVRTTALKVLSDGVTGNALAWRDRRQKSLRSLEQTLATLPSTLQERIYARGMLVFPVLLVVLAAFWLLSGLIGLFQHSAAVEVLSVKMPLGVSRMFVLGGSIVDIAIGAGLLVRPLARKACWASILVSAGYLLAASFVVPALWSDPLGPLAKVLPAMALALIVAALLEER